MTGHDPDPLTPEERELAARLARIGPHGMPSPALDARILGSAQAAAARKTASGPQRRWPAWAGIAATLALALGAVWQLRPVQEVPVALDEAPSSAAAMDMSSGNDPAEPESSAKASTARPPPVPEARAAKIAPPQPRAMPQPSPVAPAPTVFDEPPPIDAPAPVAAAAAPAAMPRKSAAAAAMESAASGAPAADAQADATLAVTDLPVASDRLLAPVDWIERIRQRRDAGDLAGARASLARLQRDHPQWVLPDDVRAIAAPPSPDR